MLASDPANDALADRETMLYECPDCGARADARGSCCCSACGCEMQNLSKPRHQ
jgi:hypothetical protein